MTHICRDMTHVYRDMTKDSHSPKASPNAIKGENFPLPTCHLLNSLEGQKDFLVARTPSGSRMRRISYPTWSESSLFSGREGSLKCSANIIKKRCDVGAGSLRTNLAGRLWRAPRTSCISAYPSFCISMYALPS